MKNTLKQLLLAASLLGIAPIAAGPALAQSTGTGTTTSTPSTTPPTTCDFNCMSLNTVTSNVGAGAQAGANGFFGSFNSAGNLVADPNGHGTITLTDDKGASMVNEVIYNGGACPGGCGTGLTLNLQAKSWGTAGASNDYVTTTPGVHAAIGNSVTVAGAGVMSFGFRLATTAPVTTGH